MDTNLEKLKFQEGNNILPGKPMVVRQSGEWAQH